ncbi:MAG TPA: ATP-binding protein, partial [Puia sp.]|nr:ATP-binding protein [Puia sp.]
SNYSPKTYDAYPQCWSITQDHNGVMYFGNGNEITEYDGSKWSKFNFTSQSQSIPRAMITDKNGVIFFGLVNGVGYLVRDSSGNNVPHLLLDSIPPSKREFSDIWSIYETPEGYYFQARERIFRFTRNQENGHPGWTVKTWDPKSKFMFAFYIDGEYYVHQRGEGLFKMINDSLVLFPGSEFLGKQRMQVMLPYKRNGTAKQFLFGTFYDGLFLYDGKQFKPFKTEADSSLRNSTLYKGLQLKDGRYVLATTGDGLLIMDDQGKKLAQLNRKTGMQDASIYFIYTDNANNLWLALDNGISKVELGSSISIYNSQLGINTGVLSAVRFEGTIYIGTSNGVMRLNHQTNHFENVQDVPPEQVFQLLVDGDQLLVTTDGLYGIRNNKVTEFGRSISGEIQLNGIFLSRKYPGLLYGCSSFGLSVFQRSKKIQPNHTGAWELVGNLPTTSEKLQTADEDQDGALWVGTNTSHVIKYTPAFDADGRMEMAHIKTEKFGVGREVGGSTINPRMIHGKFYFVADTIVYRFDQISHKLVPDNSFGILHSKDLSQGTDLMEDYSGRVWILAPFDTRIATLQADSSYKIGPQTLLPVADKVINQVYPQKGGIIWLATTEGLIRYDENSVKESNRSFRALLREVKTGQSYIDPELVSPAQISYKNNAVRFGYAAPFFDQEEKIKFQTWLEGFEPGWSAWGKNAYKEYTNLQPGKYTFHVRANNLFQQNSEPATFSFEVMPPWYRTWLAYALYVLTLGAFVWSFIYFRSKKLVEENRKLEEKISTRTAELNESLTELKSAQAQLIQSEKMASLGELTAGIAHEIKNPLNFINNFAEVNAELLTEMKSEIGKANYTEVMSIMDDVIKNEMKISHHGKRADSIVRTMASHLREGQQQKLPTDLSAMAEEYLLLSYHAMRAGNNAFNCDLKTDFSGQLGPVKLIPGDISRVITNIYNNAFYSMAEKMKERGNGYKPVIEVKTKAVNGMAEVEITDNGKGIPAAILNKIYQPFFTTKPSGEGTGLGLSLSYDIIKAHGGRLEAQTEEGKCTSFTIFLPLG